LHRASAKKIAQQQSALDIHRRWLTRLFLRLDFQLDLESAVSSLRGDPLEYADYSRQYQ
jgi:hypothetical protein